MRKHDRFDLVIIGAGAAGMAAAIEAARRGLNVCLLERMDRVGKKLLATGNGRCNLMNTGEPSYPHGEPFAKQVFNHCGVSEQQAFWRSLGLSLREEAAGRVYPACGHASVVLDALRFELERLQVQIITGCAVSSVRQAERSFEIRGEHGEHFHASNLLIAAGGRAQPKLGSNGSGAQILASLGHPMVAPQPGLTQLECETHLLTGLSGQRFRCYVRLMRGSQLVHEEAGEVLVTDYGLSGVVIMNTASFAIPGDTVHLNLMDSLGITPAELSQMMSHRRTVWASDSLDHALLGLCVPRMSEAILRAAGITGKKRTLASLTDQEQRQIIAAAEDLAFQVKARRGFESAQVTQGGADTSAFDPDTMESRLVPGLYAAGEVLDVDGACGGFNLMFSFGSGMLAGRKVDSHADV